MKLIDKDALVAEIERLKKAEGWCQVGKDTADVYYARGFRFACERIKDALDTLKVKEMDLEKEIKDYFDSQPIITRSKGVDYQLIPSSENIAKHFFELGLKAQKGE